MNPVVNFSIFRGQAGICPILTKSLENLILKTDEK
jgi:hypothetical protein